MSNLVPQNFGAVSAKFAAVVKPDNDLAAGVQQGFGIIGYKGKVWSTRYRGTTNDLLRPDGDGPMNSIEVVILKASAHVSKIWYENGFVEGSNASPDCFSTNGVNPDMQSKKRQATSCALCPKNQWGSRVTPQGKPGKACSDSKRLAIVPLPDIPNEGLGGPMLLRVPAASLGDLAAFGEKMQNMGYPYFSIGVRVAFDTKEAYPKFVFSAIRPLTDTEAELVLDMREQPQVNRILAEGSEMAGEAPAPAETPASVFEQPPQGATAQAQPVSPINAETAAVAATGFGAVSKPAAPEQTQQAQPQTANVAPADAPATMGSDFEKALDDQLNALLPA